MPIDPQIALQVKPIPIQDPLEQTGRVLAIRNAVQQGQMGALNLEQKRIQMDQAKAINKAYMDALTVDQATGKATVDTSGLTKALALGGHGVAIPGILHGINQSQKAIAELAETKLKVKNLENDAAGAVGAATLAADGDPRLFLTQLTHATKAGAVSEETALPLIQHVQGLLNDPDQADAARDVVRKISQQFVAGSEKYSQLANSKTSAEGRLLSGKAAEANSERQAETADILNQERMEKDALKMRADAFAGARAAAVSGDPQAYKQFVDSQPAAIQGELYKVAPPSKYDPAKTSQALDQAMMTPAQRETARATAQRVLQQEADRKKAQAQRDRALGISEERLDRESKQTKNSEAQDRRSAEFELQKLHLREATLNAQRRKLGEALKKDGPDATVTDTHGNAVSAASQLEDVTNEYKELIADKYNAFGRTGRGAPAMSYDDAIKALNEGLTPKTPTPVTANRPAVPPPVNAPKPQTSQKPRAGSAGSINKAELIKRAKEAGRDPDAAIAAATAAGYELK